MCLLPLPNEYLCPSCYFKWKNVKCMETFIVYYGRLRSAIWSFLKWWYLNLLSVWNVKEWALHVICFKVDRGFQDDNCRKRNLSECKNCPSELCILSWGMYSSCSLPDLQMVIAFNYVWFDISFSKLTVKQHMGF